MGGHVQGRAPDNTQEDKVSEKFDLVKQYLYEMEMPIVHEDPDGELVVLSKEDDGINNLVVDCEDPILVIEQVVMDVPAETGGLFKRLLQMNRELVHGAFALDEEGVKIIFRDTLQLENLDRNELEGSVRSLSLAMAEYSGEFLAFAGK